MRGTLMAGVVIVLLIIGFLVIKNMGGDPSAGAGQTQAKKYIERAADTRDRVGEKVKSLSELTQKVE